MKYTLQQPGMSIYKLEQYILKIFKFSIAGDYRTIEQGQTTYPVGKPLTHIVFFLALADPTIFRPKSKFLIYSTQAAVLRYHPTIFNNDSRLRQTANLQCA